MLGFIYIYLNYNLNLGFLVKSWNFNAQKTNPNSFSNLNKMREITI